MWAMLKEQKWQGWPEPTSPFPSFWKQLHFNPSHEVINCHRNRSILPSPSCSPEMAVPDLQFFTGEENYSWQHILPQQLCVPSAQIAVSLPGLCWEHIWLLENFKLNLRLCFASLNTTSSPQDGFSVPYISVKSFSASILSVSFLKRNVQEGTQQIALFNFFILCSTGHQLPWSLTAWHFKRLA